MKQIVAVCVALAIAAPALAQEAIAPPTFVPWEVNQMSDQALENALGEIPAKYSMPIINFIQQQERIAQQRVKAQSERKAPAKAQSFTPRSPHAP